MISNWWLRCGVVMGATLLVAMTSRGAQQPPAISSPDGRLSMTLAIAPDKKSSTGEGQLVYSVAFRGKTVLEPSTLGLELADGTKLGTGVQIVSSHPSQGSDDYRRIAGKSSAVHDRYNSLQVAVADQATTSHILTIEARAYDGAIAFRYVVPKQASLSDFRLKNEATEFRPSTDATAWALELPNYKSSYESEYVQLALSAFSNQGGVASHLLLGLPLLMHLPGTAWVAITEADLEGNAAMYLTNPSGSWTGHWLVSELSPRFDQPDLSVIGTLPHSSAWRVMLIGDRPAELMESNVVADLNSPNALKDTSWIHPGKASWDWWSGDVGPDGKAAYTTKNMEYYVDFAAQSGFPYMMLDAGWSTIADITKMRGNVDVPELVRYAAAKGVKVWIWIYAKSTAAQMQTAFPLYQSWGVAGVKIDFVNRNDQEGIQFYYDVARLAAEHHLMVDFHGTTQPWGLERTYPNVLGYEAVLGMEQAKAGRRDGPVDRTVFPFTRMLTGPLDYTPGGFENTTEDDFVARMDHPMVTGTRAQQLALYVIYEAPFQMVSDAPSSYQGQPAFQFIKDVPVTWDATHVVNGTPGEFVTIARKHGDDWYLGSITNWTARDLNIPLDFLGKRSYTAEIYEDASDAEQNPKHTSIRKQMVHQGDALKLHLAAGGGCAVRFTPIAN